MPIFRFKRQSLGEGFSDFLSKESRSVSSFSERKESPFRRTYAVILSFLVFFALSGRLFYLTVVRGAYFRNLSENNRLREKRIEPQRGVIYDRNGIILARNIPIHKECQIVNEDQVCHFLSPDKALQYEAKGEKIFLSLGREYPEASSSAHIAGYIKETTKEDLKDERYALGDWIGATGAEEAFENLLRGFAGKRLVEVDAKEVEVRELGRVEPISGKNIYLSVDNVLQKKAASLLNGKKGAIIASIPQTGEILVLHSSPSFDPNIFVGGSGEISQVMNDADQPLFNRAVSGTYPPGSTFKIVVAASALEEKKIDENTKINDTGIIRIGQFSFSNWYYTQYGKTEGEIGIVRAIARSNDVFFYKLGEMVGEDSLIEWAKKFKLGTKLGIEIAGESEGIIKEERKIYLGDLYHLAIGQGDLSVTPLQVNSWTQTIANGGKMCKPTIVRNQKSEIRDQKDCQDLGISETTIKLITEGMKEACSSGGTAYPLFNFKIPIACKTGTAEFGDPKNKTHAWITAFAPIDDPQIAITVLVEEGGEGSADAAPIAKEMLKSFFEESGE